MQIHGPSHIPIAETRLTYRCFWKVGIPLESKQGISSNLKMILGTRSFSQFAVLKLVFLQTWDGVNGETLKLIKGRQSTCLFDGKCGMALNPMRGNQASSRVDFGYTENFHVPPVTSGSL